MDSPFEVVLSTGELCFSETDFEIDGLIPISFDRTYRSGFRTPGVWGPGWNWPLAMQLRRTGDRLALAVDNDAESELFEAAPNGSYVAASGALLTSDQGWFVVRGLDEYIYYFSPIRHNEPGSGLLMHILDQAGNRVSLDYQDRQCNALTDANGRRYDLHYDVFGRLREVRLAVGRVLEHPAQLVRYDYDLAGNLIQVTDRCGHARRYQYDEHLLVAYTNRLGGTTFAQYDASRRCLAHWASDGRNHTSYRYSGPLRAVTNGIGDTTLFELDEKGSIQEKVDVDGRTESSVLASGGDLLASSSGWGDNMIQTSQQSGSVRNTRFITSEGEHRLAWDDVSRTQTIVDPAGGTWLQKFDARGLLTLQQTPRGATTEVDYDAAGIVRQWRTPLGNLIQLDFGPGYRNVVVRDSIGEVKQFAWDAEGNLTLEAMAGWQPLRYEWDPLGRPRRAELPTGGSYSFETDADGNVVTITDPLGGTTRIAFDSFGRVLSVLDPLARLQRYEYDLLGRLVKIVNPANETIEYGYDARNNLTRICFFDGRVEEYAYDENGRLASVLRADGSTIKSRYDSAGRVLGFSSPRSESNFEYGPTGALTAAGCDSVQESFVNDLEGNCIVENQAGIVLERAFDLEGNCLSLTIPGVGTRETRYDVRGRPVSLKDFNGQEYQFTHDLSDRLTRFSGAAGSVAMEYSPIGRTRSISLTTTASHHRIQFDYDALGRRIQDDYGDGDRLLYRFDAAGRLVETRRDRPGATSVVIETKRDQDDHILASSGPPWSYAAGGQVTRAGTVSYDRDALGRAVRRVTAEGTAELAYSDLDFLRTVNLSGGSVCEYDHDPFARRLMVRENGSASRFVWDADQVVAFFDGSTVAASFVLDGEGRPLLVSGKTGSTLIAPSDNGFPALSGLPGGDVMLAMQRPDGTPWEGAPPVALRYLGQWADESTGLFYNRHRFYDPASLTFLTPDPLSVDGSWGIYSYPLDPLSEVDPEGLMPSVSVIDCAKKKKKKKGKKRGAPGKDAACNTSRGASIHNDCMKLLKEKLDNAQIPSSLDEKMPNGMNRPDLYVQGARNTYVEFDNPPYSRVKKHHRDICKNDPTAKIYQVKFGATDRYTKLRSGKKPKKPGTIQRGKLKESDCGIDQMSF